MRHRFDQGQTELIGRNVALEQRQKTCGGGVGRGKMGQQPQQRANR